MHRPDPIERQFSEQLRNHRMPLDMDAAWEQIEADLPTRKYRPAIFWWLLAAAFFVLAGWYFWRSQQLPSLQPEPVAAVVTAPLPSSPIISSETVMGQEDPTVLPQGRDFSDPGQNPANQQPATANLPLVKHAEQHHRQTPVAVSSTPSLPQNQIVNRPASPPTAQLSTNIKVLPSTTQYPAPTLFDHTVSVCEPVHLRSTKLLALPASKLGSPHYPTQQPDTKATAGLFLSPMLGIGYPIHRLSANNDQGVIAAHKQKAYQQVIGSGHLALLAGWQFASGWYVQTGLSYQHHLIERRYLSSQVDVLPGVLQTSPTDPFRINSVVLRTEQTTTLHYHEHMLYNIPVQVGYRLGKRRWKGFAAAGASFNLGHTYQGDLLLSDDGTIRINARDLDFYQSKLATRWTGQAGVSYQLRPGWDLELSAHWISSGGNWLNEEMDFAQKVSVPSLLMGSRFAF